jgi:predicted RNA binding protein YcfA (HicA-like mRNA interferase family)
MRLSGTGNIPSINYKISNRTEILENYKAGGEPRKGKGDHINIKMPNGQLITIPISGEVKLGLLKAAIRKVGLTEDEYMKYLEG